VSRAGLRRYRDASPGGRRGPRIFGREDRRRLLQVPDPLITTSPDRLGGTPVFAETRVPVQTLVDYLEAGDALDDFLADFPSVSREHAVAVLELAKSALLDKAVGA